VKLSVSKDLTSFRAKYPNKFQFDTITKELTLLGEMTADQLSELKTYFTDEADQTKLDSLKKESKTVKLSHFAMVSEVNTANGTFTVQGAHKSTGTDIISEGDYKKNGVVAPYYFSSIDQYWINYIGSGNPNGRSIAGIGRVN